MWSKIRPFLFFLVPLVLVLVVSNYLQLVVLSNKDEITKWLQSFGPFIILVYVILQFISVVIAPLGGFVLIVVMITLFGPGWALSLGYLVSAPAYLFNFYLAKRFGRPFVKKILGTGSLKTLDRYVEDAGLVTLIILRMFQGGSFDYLSYAFGLTKISFRIFAVVTILAGIPGTLITYLIFRRYDDLTRGIIVMYAMTAVLFGIAFLFNFFRKRRLTVNRAQD